MFSYLAKYHRFTETEKQLIKANCRWTKVAKGNYFLEEGRYCKRIGFVIKGILRIYHYDAEGKDITKYFIAREQIATNLKSYTEGTVSDTYIQAEIDSELLVISKESMANLSAQIVGWDKVIHDIIESKLLEKVTLKTNMISQDATAKYLNFLKTHPNIINHVPLSHVASYLGITQFSLSRIRRNVTHHHLLPNDKN
ncbi:MAG: Crp/Fnr family transcriptional regulator [Bacteroidota bacterium]